MADYRSDISPVEEFMLEEMEEKEGPGAAEEMYHKLMGEDDEPELLKPRAYDTTLDPISPDFDIRKWAKDDPDDLHRQPVRGATLMAQITVDLDDIAQAEIDKLKKQVASLERKNLAQKNELDSMKGSRKAVREALEAIRNFAEDLPHWDDEEW